MEELIITGKLAKAAAAVLATAGTDIKNASLHKIAEKASEVLKENGLWELIYKDR